MNIKESILAIVIVCIGVASGILVGSTLKDVPILSGNVTPQFSGAEVINSSSSVSAQGAVIITNASNTGTWFRGTNTSAVRVFCGPGTTTSTLTVAGQLLAPVTSSTGSNVWEERGMAGPVSCLAEATGGIISFSYTSR